MSTAEAESLLWAKPGQVRHVKHVLSNRSIQAFRPASHQYCSVSDEQDSSFTNYLQRALLYNRSPKLEVTDTLLWCTLFNMNSGTLVLSKTEWNSSVRVQQWRPVLCGYQFFSIPRVIVKVATLITVKISFFSIISCKYLVLEKIFF